MEGLIETKIGLKELKERYSKLREEYDIPEFSELNKAFDIEELADCETDFYLRKIRKIVSEKIVGYLRFLEIILNPSNAPIFFFKLIKKLDDKDKGRLTKIYEKLGNMEIEIVKLDLDYSEEKEAEFIKKIFDFFMEIKGEILEIIGKMLNGENESARKKGRGYFG